jgi:uncharacterized protein (TIGR02271 family)
MSDARDLNKDGKVSLMEKVKDKLHLGHKDDAYDTTTTSTHHSTTSSTAHHSALPATTHTSSALPASTHTSHTGYSSALPATGAMPVTGMAAVPMVPVTGVAALPATTTGAGYGLDSRDLNRDGHVSMTEKLASGATGIHNTGSSAYTSGAGYDSRDLNRDGHVSASEKLKTGAIGTHTSTSTGFDSRDLNRDGHISTGERLAAGSSHLSDEEMRLRLHEEQLAISKREVGAGEVDIHKRVHEQHVQQTVPVRREEVIVERRPLSGVAEPGARIAAQDETMRVALFREEIVTEKRIVPTEEVIVRKQEVVDQQTVGATLRSEHVETVQTGTHSSSVVGGINESNIHGSTMGMNNTGAYNSKDLNNDGRVSMGEKVKSATTGAYNPAAGSDSQDLNGDGRVTMGEKLKNNTTGAFNTSAGYDP